MPQSRPVISLQFGTFANFVGAHFWNFQDELFARQNDFGDTYEFNEDVLYREGENELGTRTYTPRTLIFDIKSELGTLKQSGFLYQNSNNNEENDPLVWNRSVEKHEVTPYQKNDFLQFLDEEEEENKETTDEIFPKFMKKKECNVHSIENINNESDFIPDIPCHPFNLDSHVRYWSDYFKVHVHPKTIQTVPIWDVEQSSFNFHHSGFDPYVIGENFLEDSFDNFRYFMEECDVVHGLQTIVDLDHGFGGLASEFLLQVREECPNTPLICFTLHDRMFQSTDHSHSNPYHHLNVGFSMANLTELASVVIPFDESMLSQISPHLAVKMDSPYSTSAVLGSALEVLSSSYRSNSNKSMSSFINSITRSDSKQLAHCEIAFPVENPNISIPELSEILKKVNSNEKKGLFKPLLKTTLTQGVSCHAEVFTFRGLRQINSQAIDTLMPNLMTSYNTHVFRTPIPIPLSFPSLFRSYFGDDGIVHGQMHHDLAFGRTRITQCAMASRVVVSEAIFPLLDTIYQTFSHTKIQLMQRIIANYGLQSDDFTETRQKLLTLADSYSLSTKF